MRVVCFCCGHTDYTIQFSNNLSQKEAVMLLLPEKSINEHVESIDKKVILRSFTYEGIKHYKIIKTFYEINKYINEFKPDVIHILADADPLFWFFIPFVNKYPIVVTVHDHRRHLGEEKLLAKLIMFFARKLSTKILIHSKTLKETIIKKSLSRSSKINVISFGEHEVAPFKKYERPDLKEDGALILFFGRIWKYKGLDYLIKAEPLITRTIPNAKIVIAGTGEGFKKYEKMMINKNNFIVHNYRIPYKEGAELFQKCSVVVLPYIEASQSGVIPTAYGFKKPVVVTNVGAIPEIVEDGVTGFIIPPRNPEALAGAIVRLLKDGDLRKRMGENAYKKLKADFSWDKIAEKTIEVYKEAIKEHQKQKESKWLKNLINKWNIGVTIFAKNLLFFS